ncbi:MAG: TonB family protein [Bacteroidales bacterium]|nr:TonB family protein [Bacteroidales bacterium]
MKKTTLITLLLIIINSYSAKGQDTITSYYNSKWEECPEERALYYRKAYPDPDSPGMWIVKDYHKNGQLQMTGQYSDKKLKKQQGKAIFYHYNGNVASEGQYLNNKKVGIWKYYFLKGPLRGEGNVVDDKREGIWTFYHQNGSVFGKENFKKDKAEGESKWYYESGKISEIAIYKNGTVIDKTNFEEDGNILETAEEDSNASFIGEQSDIVRFITENIQYPKELQKKGKEGAVLLSFTVGKDGRIDNIEIAKPDHPLFNEEALRVLRLIKKMKPAREHGQIVEQDLFLPVTFRLK